MVRSLHTETTKYHSNRLRYVGKQFQIVRSQIVQDGRFYDELVRIEVVRHFSDGLSSFVVLYIVDLYFVTNDKLVVHELFPTTTTFLYALRASF